MEEAPIAGEVFLVEVATVLISYFSASGKALISGLKILLRGRTDSRMELVVLHGLTT